MGTCKQIDTKLEVVQKFVVSIGLGLQVIQKMNKTGV